MAESSRTYSVVGKNLTITGAVTLAFLNPGTTASLEILRVMVSQAGTTVGQQLGIQLSTQVTGFPTLVSATPAQWSTSDPASKIVGGTTGAAGSCGINASAEGAGAKIPLIADAFYNLNPYYWVPTPDERILLPAGSTAGFGVVLLTAPTTLTGWNVNVVYAEI